MADSEDRTTIVRFAHDSERRLAALFEFHDIAWQYEPVEFALYWDGDGRPSSGFRPDFYLPDYDLFIELTTTWQQRLVTKKNRKLRHVCLQLYPEDLRRDPLSARTFSTSSYANRFHSSRCHPRSDPPTTHRYRSSNHQLDGVAPSRPQVSRSPLIELDAARVGSFW